MSRREQALVYLIVSGEKAKVGYSIDPVRRFNEIYTGDRDARLIGAAYGGYRVEQELHRKYDSIRIDKEWFRYTKELEEEFRCLKGFSESGFSERQRLDEMPTRENTRYELRDAIRKSVKRAFQRRKVVITRNGDHKKDLYIRLGDTGIKVREHWLSKPASVRQLVFLNGLGYEGYPPENMLEAHCLIRVIKYRDRHSW